MTELRKTMEPVAWQVKLVDDSSWLDIPTHRVEEFNEAAHQVRALFHLTDADRDRILALEAENKSLRDALGFYAREYSWRSSTVYACGHSGKSSAEIDRGQKARATLTTGDSDAE